MLPARSSHNSNACAHGEQIGGRTCRAMHWDARSDKWWQDDGSEGRGPRGPAATKMPWTMPSARAVGLLLARAARKRMKPSVALRVEIGDVNAAYEGGYAGEANRFSEPLLKSGAAQQRSHSQTRGALARRF